MISAAAAANLTDAEEEKLNCARLELLEDDAPPAAAAAAEGEGVSDGLLSGAVLREAERCHELPPLPRLRKMLRRQCHYHGLAASSSLAIFRIQLISDLIGSY